MNPVPARINGRKNNAVKSAQKRKTGLSTEKRILDAASKNFGYTMLRPGQGDAIAALLKKKDALVVMPTGSGKSAIYQIAGVMMPGSVLVVSPLIALQKDQVDALNETKAKGEAVIINSALSTSELRENFEKIAGGEGKFIFLAPEQLRKQETIEALERSNIKLFVVDEAHCISEWGHDFRPDYLQLGPVVDRLNHPVVLAMTATASAQVREEIRTRLHLKNTKVLVQGFDRPNIFLRVDHFPDPQKKLEALVHRVRWADKPGLVYVSTRRSAEDIMRMLAEEGVNALHYHGGLKASERTEYQERFMNGEAEVIVATNAFGMGVDKADIRFVYHFDIPDSLDSYYQEIGRAGRDGKRAEACLFFREQDIGQASFRAGEGKLDEQQLEQLVEVIADQEGPVEPEEIAEQANLPERKLTTAIHRLEDVGAVRVLPSGEVSANEDLEVQEAAEAAAREQELRRETRKDRLQRMREYAETTACRREHLLNYFGDDFNGPCNNCDNCQAAHPEMSVDPSVGTRREVVA